MPVVESGRLVGIISERDFMRIFSELIEEFLNGKPEAPALSNRPGPQRADP
jgi:hypothetical protein